MNFEDYRQVYNKGVLLDVGLPDDPIELFKYWTDEALECDLPEPYTFSLATCGADGLPSVRTLLLREITKSGMVFYTNYDSDKGRDLQENPHAEALFFWHALERQVRLGGTVRKLPETVSAEYFAKRPFESQIGAWVSEPQSGVVASREVIEQRFAQLSAEYAGKTVPKPDYWGGYELVVNKVEFWQGRIGRLHDRILYVSSVDGWLKQRLLP